MSRFCKLCNEPNENILNKFCKKCYYNDVNDYGIQKYKEEHKKFKTEILSNIIKNEN